MTTMEISPSVRERLPVTAPQCGSGSNAQSFASKRKPGEFYTIKCANPECQNTGALILVLGCTYLIRHYRRFSPLYN